MRAQETKDSDIRDRGNKWGNLHNYYTLLVVPLPSGTLSWGEELAVWGGEGG